MNENIIYSIGEALAVEVEEIQDLQYEDKYSIFFSTVHGKKYKLVLHELSQKDDLS